MNHMNRTKTLIILILTTILSNNIVFGKTILPNLKYDNNLDIEKEASPSDFNEIFDNVLDYGFEEYYYNQSYIIKLNSITTKAGEEFTVNLLADAGRVTFTKINITLKFDTDYLSYIDGEYAKCDGNQIVIDRTNLYHRQCCFAIKFKAIKDGITEIKVINYEMLNHWGNAQICELVEKSTIKIIKNNNTNYYESGDEYEVVKGDTLWNIASEMLGDGKMYTDIYNANSDKIKDPRLIYPGQKIIIP